ncbi:MAG: hypothetical protein HRT37_04350 [Alteromonadaceae bacterium]|nr:hypothetical protein [Alteromonadaceae bacterium]
MEFQIEQLLLVLIPWCIFFILGVVATNLVKSARARKGTAIAICVFVQMFSPDPYVERTIEMVTVEKKAPKKQQDESDEPLSIDDCK